MNSQPPMVVQWLEASGFAPALGLSPYVLAGILAAALGVVAIAGAVIAIRKRSDWKGIGDDIGRDLEVEDAAEKNFPTSQELSEMDPTIPSKRLD